MDYRQTSNKFKAPTKRYEKGTRGTIFNQYGVKFTKKEQKEFKEMVARVNRQVGRYNDKVQKTISETNLSEYEKKKLNDAFGAKFETSFHYFQSKNHFKKYMKNLRKADRQIKGKPRNNYLNYRTKKFNEYNEKALKKLMDYGPKGKELRKKYRELKRKSANDPYALMRFFLLNNSIESGTQDYYAFLVGNEYNDGNFENQREINIYLENIISNIDIVLNEVK